MNLTASQIAAIAKSSGFQTPQAIATITAISLAESGGNTSSINTGYTLPTGAQSENSVGLAQINTLAHPNYSASALTNPFTNLAAALNISGGGTNFTPWTTYTNGAYQKYLPQATQAAVMATSVPTFLQQTLAGLQNFSSNVSQNASTSNAVPSSSSAQAAPVSFTSDLAGIANDLNPINVFKQFYNIGSNLANSGAKSTTQGIASIASSALGDLVKVFLSDIPWIEIAEGTIGVFLAITGLIMLWGSLLGEEMGPIDAATKVGGMIAE